MFCPFSQKDKLQTHFLTVSNLETRILTSERLFKCMTHFQIFMTIINNTIKSNGIMILSMNV